MKNDAVLHYSTVWLAQTQTWLYSQLSELQRLGLDAQVVCERTENLDQFNVKNIHCFANEYWPVRLWDAGLRYLRFRRHLDFLVRIGKSTDAKIVHSHFGNCGWTNLGAVRALGARHVVTFYGLDVNMLPQQARWRRRYIQLFSEADLFLCEGPHMAKCLVALGCPEPKIRIQRLGIQLEKIPFRPRIWQPGEPLRILIAATFREKKGIPIAIEALGKIQHEFPIEITLIGEATHEKRSQVERENIFQKIAHHQLESRIRLLGFQPHSVLLEEAYRHHIFLSPSITAEDGDTEGGAPVSIIEMAASGMPIVSTRHCDIPDVMRPEISRFLVSERDPDAIVEVIRNMVNNWGDLGNPLATLRNHIENEYDDKIQGERLACLYREMLCN